MKRTYVRIRTLSCTSYLPHSSPNSISNSRRRHGRHEPSELHRHRPPSLPPFVTVEILRIHTKNMKPDPTGRLEILRIYTKNMNQRRWGHSFRKARTLFNYSSHYILGAVRVTLEVQSRVVVMAATSRPNSIDTALCHPFVTVDILRIHTKNMIPDPTGRLEILRIYTNYIIQRRWRRSSRKARTLFFT
ncbi:hypothetical protein EXIGLDRAFT_481567 [Exidia glandulosa HHB12029]|uniref:Uncharacterized protein n=1 Tax=Exidia glandulosa HHB12029 TaxID=1314781 RepID=A0A165PH45_EXIGL|nr:hypothetical protein EXIGLDRAFT_481567 [Exidia glandulosa HHB12029]